LDIGTGEKKANVNFGFLFVPFGLFGKATNARIGCESVNGLLA